MSITWSDRQQHFRFVSECRYAAELLIFDCSTIYSLEEANGWIDEISSPWYTSAQDYFYTIHPYQAPESGLFYNQVVRVSTSDGSIEYLTTGQVPVYKIVDFNENTQQITYSAAVQETPYETALYTVSTTSNRI